MGRPHDGLIRRPITELHLTPEGSGLSIILWNICQSLGNKLQESDFLEIICKYDIICLYECWIDANDDILPNYS